MSKFYFEFLKRLNNIMYLKYDKVRRDFEEKHWAECDEIVWVFELLECPMKKPYRENFRELEEAERFKPSIMLGELLHQALSHYFPTSPFEDVKYRLLTMEGRRIILAGLPDWYDDEGNVLEFKYARRRPDAPLPHHAAQVGLYLNILGGETGELWYITPDGFACFTGIKPASDDEIAALLKSRKIPMWPDWECEYCPFVKLCGKSIESERL